jgi:hypothetical protein
VRVHHGPVAEERRFAGWRPETVVSALLAGVVAVVVALLAVAGGLRGGGDDGASGPPISFPESRPQIFVNETAFTSGSTGGTVIRVAGAVLSFRPGDRLYAIAKPPARRSWWISDPIIPLLGGDWVAMIEADPRAGEQIIVSAVRIPAEKYEEPSSTVPWPLTPGPPTGDLSTPELIERELRARGDNAFSVDVWSNSLAVISPAR